MSDDSITPILASGELQVLVRHDPWEFVVARPDGHVVLTQASGTAGPAGPIAFQAGPEAPDRRWKAGAYRQLPSPADEVAPATDSWWAATHVVSSVTSNGSYEAVLATNDPEGRTIAFSAELLDATTVAVLATVEGGDAEIEAFSQGWTAEPDERWLGFGERSQAVSISQGVIEHYVGEGPYQPHEYPWLEGTVPTWALRQRTDATYFPIPWALSTRGYGVLLDNHEISYHRFRTETPDVWSFETEAATLKYRLFCGTSPLDALAKFTAAVGRQPAVPRWFFGPWYQTGHENHVPLDEEKRQLDVLRSAGAPVSAAETHCRYLPVGEDRGFEADETARVDFFHAGGLAVVSYLNPLISVDYPGAFAAAQQADALQRTAEGTTYLYQGYAGGRTPPHTIETQYDFSHPAAIRCWGDVAARLTQAGYDGWMEDFGEYTPLDSVSADGLTGTAHHNRYATDYHAATAAVAEELAGDRDLARFVRSGWTGTAAMVPIVWGGDPTTSWGFDGLASAVIEGLSAGASGVAMWGSDTGGFFSTMDRLTPELLCRWIQFSALCPVMRTKSFGIEIPKYERPQIWDDEILPVWRRWASLHTQLSDYLASAHDHYRRTGKPIMTALELAHPGMAEAAGLDDQYLLGADLLVAPVLAPGVTERPVVIPPGDWVDLWSTVEFDSTARSLKMSGGRGHVVSGPVTVLETVDPTSIPVYLRAGAILCLLPGQIDSLSPYGAGADGVESLAEHDDRRLLLAWVGESWGGLLAPGVTGESVLSDSAWSLNVESDSPRLWQLQAWLGSIRPASVEVNGPTPSPASVEVNGQPATFSFDESSQVISLDVSGQTWRLEISWVAEAGAGGR